MGLDMTLKARGFLTEYSDPALHSMMSALTENIRFGSDIQYIEVEAIYWRKANQIHRWFVEKIQDGVDECQEVPVTRDDLVELHRLISNVIEHPEQAQELMPPQEGFFFGSTEIDDYYWDQLRRTQTRLMEILEQADPMWTFYYQSSW